MENKTEEQLIEIVTKDGMQLEFIQHQTEKICIAAVQENGFALQYVQQQTEKICVEAIKSYGCYALQYVQEQTELICHEVIKDCGLYALHYVKNRTESFYITVVKNYWWLLEDIENQTLPICIEACKQNKKAFKYIHKNTFQIDVKIFFGKYKNLKRKRMIPNEIII